MGVFPQVTPYPWLGADVPMLMGSYDAFSPNKSQVDTATMEASRYLQHIFGTFLRDPAHGLQQAYHWPTFAPNQATLIELFPNNTASAVLNNVAV